MPLRSLIMLWLAVVVAAPTPALADPSPGTLTNHTQRRGWRALRINPVQAARYGVMGVVNGVRGAVRVGVKLGGVAGHVSGIGSVGLTAHSAYQLIRARNGAQRLDACRDLGTGMAGLGRLGYWASPISLKVGLVGAGVQSTVGAYGLFRGLRERDRPKIILGALDLGAGLLFGASMLSYLNPYTMVAALALTTARVGYAKRHGIKSAVEKLRDHLMRRKRPRPKTSLKPNPTPKPAPRGKPRSKQRLMVPDHTW